MADHAFSYANGVKTDLGTLPGGGSSSWAMAINPSGQIVGNAYLADNFTRRAFVYSDGVMTPKSIEPRRDTDAHK